MPNRTVTIEIKTLSDLAGLTKTITAMDKMSRAAEKLNNQWSNAGNAKTMASAIKSMGTSFENIANHGPNATRTVRNFTTAMKNLDKALSGVPIELKSLAAAIRQTAESTKSWNDQNKALNKESELITTITNKLDRYGRLRERITTKVKSGTAAQADGTETARMTEQIRLLEKFDSQGKLVSKSLAQNAGAGGIGAWSTNLQRMSTIVQNVTSKMSPFIRVITLLKSAVSNIGGRAWSLATRAINSFGNSASSLFARLRASLAASGGLFTAFHKRVEDSMARSKRATLDFLNSGWSFLTSGYTTRAFGQGVLQRGGGILTDYMDFEKNVVRTAVAGSTDPETIRKLVFGMQRGTFGQTPIKQFTAEEIADMAYYYASAIGQQITGENMQDLAPVLANFLQIANVTRTAPEVVTKGIINAATEFGIDPRKVENIPELQTLGTQMAYLSNISTLEFPDIAESFKMVGPLASQLGASPQDAMALLYLMSESGLRGGQAGRGISQTFSRLLDPTEKMLGLSKQYGMTPGGTREQWHQLFFDETGQLRGGVGGMLATIQSTTQNPQQMAQIVAELFSENATRALVGSLAQLFQDQGKFQDIIEELTGNIPTDWLGRAVKENNDSLASSFAWLKAAWFQVTTAMVTAIQGPLMKAFDSITNALFKFSDALQNNPGIARFIAALFAILGVVTEVIGTLFIGVGSVLLMAKAFSLTSGFGLRFAGVILGIVHTFARLLPTLILVSAISTAFVVAWQQDFLGLATFFRQVDLAGVVDEAFRDITHALAVFSKAWNEFITLILGGAGTTENLRNVLETVFGEFLGTILFGQILRLKDAIHDLYEEVTNLASAGKDIDLGAVFGNLGPTIRGLVEFATTGILSKDIGAGRKFFEGLGFENGVQTFVDAGLKLRDVFGTIQNTVINAKNALAPSLTEIWTNIQRIIAVLTDGKVVVGTFGGVLSGLVVGLVGISTAIAKVTGVIASLMERFRGLAPVIGMVAGVIISVFIAKALIPFDKQLFHASAALADFAIKVVLVTSLQGAFIALKVAAQAAFAAIAAGARLATVALFEMIVGLEGAETALAQLELLGQVSTGGMLTGIPAVVAAVAGLIVLFAALGVAIYELWQTNEGFRDRMIESWEAIKNIVMDFVTGFVVGFVPVFIGGFTAMVAIMRVLADAFSYVASTLLPFIDQLNIATAVGAIFGAAVAAWALGLSVNFVLAVADAVVGLGVLAAQFLLVAGTAIAAAIDAMVAWIAATWPFLLIGAAVIAVLVALVAVLNKIGVIENPFGSLTEGLLFAVNAAKSLYDYLFKVNNETLAEKQYKVYEKAQKTYDEYDPTAEAQKYVSQQLTNQLDVGAMFDNKGFGTGEYSSKIERSYQDYLKTVPAGQQPMPRAQWFQASGGTPAWGNQFAEGVLPNYQNIKEELWTQSNQEYKAWKALREEEPKDYTTKGGAKGSGSEFRPTGIDWLDDVLSKFSVESISKMLGVDMESLKKGTKTGQFTSIEDYDAARKAQLRQIAIDQEFKRLKAETDRVELMAGERVLPSGQLFGWRDAEGRTLQEQQDAKLLAEATKTIDEQLASGAASAEELAQKLADMNAQLVQALSSVDLGQALKGLYGPYAGKNQTSAAEALYGYSGTIIQNLKDITGAETLPWQNEFELMADAAGTGGFMGQSVTGRNLHDVLRPFLETFAQQSGVQVEDLLKGIPMFYAPEQYVGMGQADLIQRLDSLTPDTYKNLDLLGSGQYGTKVFDAEGFDWTEFANYGTAQAAAGNLDWNLTDYIMEAWDMTKADAEAYIKANHLDPDILGGGTFEDTKLYADSLGGEVNVLTQEWMDYYNKVTKNGTDKTIEITQAAFDRLPDIVKIGYSNMGVQFVIAGDSMNQDLLTSAQATKDTIEDTYGNIPDHLEKLLKPKLEGGGGWSTSLVDGIVTIYDDLGNIKFTMPEADYTAWQESVNAIEEIMDGLEAKRKQYVETLNLLRGGSYASAPKYNQGDGKATGSGRRRGGGSGMGLDTEITTVEPMFNAEDLFPSVEDVQIQAQAVADMAVDTMTQAITAGTPEVQVSTSALVESIVLMISSLPPRLGPIAQSAVNAISGTLYGGVSQVGNAGYALGEAAGAGVLRGLSAHLQQIQQAASQIVTAANVGNSTPPPASPPSVGMPSLPWGGGTSTQQVAASTGASIGSVGGAVASTGSKTVSVRIDTLNANSPQDVRNLLVQIDEGLGNRFDLAQRGMYATA